jgi:hypothetical protein
MRVEIVEKSTERSIKKKSWPESDRTCTNPQKQPKADELIGGLKLLNRRARRSQEFRMQIPVAGTDTGFESTASRVEILIAWRPIYHHPRTEKPRSHSATPELRQLLNSPLSCPLLSRVAQKIANRLREIPSCVAARCCDGQGRNPVSPRCTRNCVTLACIAHPPQRMSDASGGNRILPRVSEGSSLCRLS